MAVQDPPMYLLFKVKYGHSIDTNMFETYKMAGKRVDYVVWPAVFAEEGGACLQKGVAYALPERSWTIPYNLVVANVFKIVYLLENIWTAESIRFIEVTKQMLSEQAIDSISTIYQTTRKSYSIID